MADIQKLATSRTVFRCSSSIANFYPKLKAYLKLEDWDWWRNSNDQVIFFGLYHWKDYIRFIWHRGPKRVFWCGSDILALKKSVIWPHFLGSIKANHYCENEVEQIALIERGIRAEIRPMLFDDPDKYPISYKWQERPHVFVSGRPNRMEEYGFYYLQSFQNMGIQFIYFDGTSSEEEYDKDIKNYQACIRFNEFDGFSEAVAKSILMGQYPITRIKYPMIDNFEYQDELKDKLAMLKDKKEPNIEASNYWRKTLKDNYQEVRNNW